MKIRDCHLYCVLLTAYCLLMLVGCKESATGIKFNHQAHLERGLTCEFCHPQAMTDAKVGLPTMDICANCHSIDTTKPSEKCLFCHTHPNQKVKPVMPEIYNKIIFSHKTHIQEYQLSCEKCHPKISKSKKIYGNQVPNMEYCVTCHQKGKGPQECSICHPGWDKQHPPVWHSGKWAKVHGEWSRDKNTRCTSCHTKTVCVTCHQEQEPESHTQFWKKRGHTLEVSWNRSNCQVCHKSDFCQRCHQQTPPSSHTAGWDRRHCYQCHFPLKDNGCNVCHKSADHTPYAPRIPQWMAEGHCTDCHYTGSTEAPLPPHPFQYPCMQCHLQE